MTDPMPLHPPRADARVEALTMQHRFGRVGGLVLDSIPPWRPVECGNCGLGCYEHGGRFVDAGIACHGRMENRDRFVNYDGSIHETSE